MTSKTLQPAYFRLKRLRTLEEGTGARLVKKEKAPIYPFRDIRETITRFVVRFSLNCGHSRYSPPLEKVVDCRMDFRRSPKRRLVLLVHAGRSTGVYCFADSGAQRFRKF